MSLFQELKRRNVFKVVAAYLVLAWLVLQVSDVFLNNVDAPGWVFQVLTFFLVLGLVFSVFFAWVYELTPEGLKREKEVDRSQSITSQTGRKLDFLVIGLLVAALGYFAYDKFVLDAHRDAALVEATTQALSKQAAEAEVPVDESPSIAVLPFVNMSSDAEQEYFSDGLSEELLNLLAKIPELRVTSRSSAFFYKGKDIKITDVGRELNVANVLEGSVRKSGNTIRVTAQLIRVVDDVHLWSESYDRSLEDVFAIQDEIAANVVEQLKVELLGEAPSARKTDPEAYALYLRARAAERLGTREGFENAIGLYEQLLAIDPQYAPAWAGLGIVYVNQVSRGMRDREAGYELGLKMAQRALAIDPDFANAHRLLGSYSLYHDHDLAASAKHYQHALELAPGDADVLRSASNLLFSLGRLDQTVAVEEYLVAQDPLNSKPIYNLGISYLTAGRYSQAIQALDRLLQLAPEYGLAYALKGYSQLMLGDAQSALESMQRESLELYRLWGVTIALYGLGEDDKADSTVAELRERFPDDWPDLAPMVFAFRGERDRAFEALDDLIELRGGITAEIYLDPVFNTLHDDPRWSAMLERIGRSQSLLDSIEFNIRLPSERQVAQADNS